MHQSVFSVVDDESSFAEELDNFHFVLGQRSSFSTANFLKSSHFLWSLKLSNEDVLTVHFHNTESKGDSNGDRETIRDGHHDQNDNDVDE